CVPMRSRGQIHGVVTVMRSTAGRPFDADDQIILQELADRAAMYWRKVQAFEAERRARESAERLQAVTADLAHARTIQSVGEVIMARGRESTGAYGAMFFRLDRERDEAVLVTSDGYAPERAALFERIPVRRSMPLTDCIRSGHPSYYQTREQLW